MILLRGKTQRRATYRRIEIAQKEKYVSLHANKDYLTIIRRRRGEYW